MTTYSYDDYIYTMIGVAGAAIVSTCQIPNVIRFTRRLKSKDMSYTYQSMLTLGVVMLDIYYYYYKSLLVIPTTVSVFWGVYILALKYYIEEIHSSREAGTGDCTSEDLERTLLLEGNGHSNGGGESENGYGTTHRHPQTTATYLHNLVGME